MGTTQELSPGQLNQLQREAVLTQAQPMHNSIFNQTLNPAQTPVVQIPLQNVGLVTKLLLIVSGTIQNNNASGGAALNLTEFGFGNLFNNVTLRDTQNYQRINTSGLHLNLLQSARYRRPYAQAFSISTQSPLEYGNNFPVTTAPASIAAASSGNFRVALEVPIAYSNDNLKGAMYMNLVDVTSQLNLTINPAGTAFAAAGANRTQAIYQSATGAADAVISSLTVQCYQFYLYNLPTASNGQPVLPILDINTGYLLNNSQFQNQVANQNNPYPFLAMRDYYSTFLVYDNNSGASGGLGNGSDINYFSLQQANFTNFWQDDPLTRVMMAREEMQVDNPPGTYYFGFRKRPLSMTAYGNMQLIMNPSQSTNGIVYAMWESTGLLNTVAAGSSLPA